MRTSKEREFLSLTKGSMSVDEYTNRFNALSRYATHIISFGSRKVERYIVGLRDELGLNLTMQRHDSFGEVVDLAQRSKARLIARQIVRPSISLRGGPFLDLYSPGASDTRLSLFSAQGMDLLAMDNPSLAYTITTTRRNLSTSRHYHSRLSCVSDLLFPTPGQ